MPHKFNADRRDKIPKQKHRVTNCSEYNEGLRRRGDLRFWIRGVGKSWWLGGEMRDGKPAVKGGSSCDGDAMCALWGPPHATSFAHTGVDDVIDTSLRAGRRNCETFSMSKAIVRERIKIVGKDRCRVPETGQ